MQTIKLRNFCSIHKKQSELYRSNSNNAIYKNLTMKASPVTYTIYYEVCLKFTNKWIPHEPKQVLISVNDSHE